MSHSNDIDARPMHSNGGTRCERQDDVEYRVNMTEDRDSWQDCYYLPACCHVEAERLTRTPRHWPNGKPRRWVERRQVGPWTRAIPPEVTEP